MKGLIFNTKENALEAAKSDCISQMESAFGIRLNDDAVNNSNAWTVESCSATCECGETSAVRAILFSSYVGKEMVVKQNGAPTLDLERIEEDNEQFISAYGYCDSCGSENPMP